MAQNAEHPLAGKHIIIAGGGIAGLAFARALDRSWPNEVERPRISLYEKREKEVSRDREGYSMSIRSDAMSGGMQALQKLDLLDDTLAASITGQHGGAGSFSVWDVNWKPILRMTHPKTLPDGLPAPSMRIARYILRQHLIDGLPNTVGAHWSLGCTSAEAREDGRVRVTLSDGSFEECDLLVAADGANSLIRAALRPDDTLQFAGAVCLSATAKFPAGLPDPIKRDYGIVLGENGSSLFASPVEDDSAVWNVSVLEKTPRTPLRGEEALKRKDEILDKARKLGRGFPQPFGQLVDASDLATLMVFNAMDKQPIDHSEMAGLPVVFIGDANHAVSPFAGNGANMALMDGVDLAAALCTRKDIRSAVTAFDGKSRSRSKRTVDSSHLTIKIAHSTGWSLFFWKMVLQCMNFFMSLR